MDQRSVRVVVGEDRSARKGPLRYVLEGEGFQIVGDAATTADLAPILAAEQPDVVVLDDRIGVDAVQLTRQMVPTAKIIVVWPEGVVPIGGATRVDPEEIIATLGATVARVAGVTGQGLETIERPDWIEKVRKDPATLRDMLAKSTAAPKRPSVTELQRRGQRLHPSTGMGVSASARIAEPPLAEEAAEPLVILPRGGDADRIESADEAIVVLSSAPKVHDAEPISTGADPGDVGSSGLEEANEPWDRRLGMIALVGAAVAGALMIALSLGAPSGRTVIAAEPFLPTIVAPEPPTTAPPPEGGGSPTQDGDPPSTNDPSGGTDTTTTTTGSGGSTTSPTTGGSGPAPGASQTPGASHGQGVTKDSTPGNTALHNPHGGPPGLTETSHLPLRAIQAHEARGHSHKV